MESPGHRLVYRGQRDDIRPGNNIEATGWDLRQTIDTLLAGGTASPSSAPGIGCNMKWKFGNAPGCYSPRQVSCSPASS